MMCAANFDTALSLDLANVSCYCISSCSEFSRPVNFLQNVTVKCQDLLNCTCNFDVPDMYCVRWCYLFLMTDVLFVCLIG